MYYQGCTCKTPNCKTLLARNEKAKKEKWWKGEKRASPLQKHQSLMEAYEQFIVSVKLENAYHYSCGLCPPNEINVFKSKYSVVRHIHNMHSETKKSYMCVYCDKMYRRQDSLKEHRKTHLPREKRVLTKCEQCEK